jgi:ketosteroid isomerase-like protein
MQRRHLTLVTAFGGLSVMARPGWTMTQMETEGLRAANAAFDAAVSARDLERLEELWAHDETVMAVHPQDRILLTGWDAVRRSWQEVFTRFAEVAVTMPDPRVHLMGDMALVAGLEHFRGRRAADHDAVAFDAMTTNGYERRGGHWLLVRRHSTMLAA